MGEENNNEKNTTFLHDITLHIIICLILLGFYLAYKAGQNTAQPQNIGSLQHYDSLYNERQWHISMDPNGNVIGYHTPDGLYYTFEEPIPENTFFNN